MKMPKSYANKNLILLIDNLYRMQHNNAKELCMRKMPTSCITKDVKFYLSQKENTKPRMYISAIQPNTYSYLSLNCH